MKSYIKSVQSAYKERSDFILVALTGRTGSGCSTAASILHTPNFDALDLQDPRTRDFKDVDERKYNIIYNYAKEGHWQGFDIIEASSIIFSYIIESGIAAFKDYICKFREINKENQARISSLDELEREIDGLTYMFEDGANHKLEYLSAILTDESRVAEYYTFYLEKLPSLKRVFSELLNHHTCHEEYESRFAQTKYVKTHLYTYLMQIFGNNLRSSGNPYDSTYTEEHFYCVAQRIDQIVQIIRQYNRNNGQPHTRICLDAIRNPYEAFYFKDKYSAFYLISLNTEEDVRRNRLGHLDKEELESLDKVEFDPKSQEDYGIFFHQNISACLEIADIHLYNPQESVGKYYFLTSQILKYVCLMIHPGLITPTNIERCMQLASTVKLNSGCLSRQVGAVITDKNYSVKAVGWNDVPEGQISCCFRDIEGYCVNREKCTYSTFERQDSTFSSAIDAMRTKLMENPSAKHGRKVPYCFKDVYNSIRNGENNQVHTRSLHAEENAFLQLCKYGGQGIQGGRLFVTASPCELCSKKSYHLGIRDIYYIDVYPGISFSHILQQNPEYDPKLHLFYGAIGTAYTSLYTQRIAIKDELALMTGVKGKRAKDYTSERSWSSAPRSQYEFKHVDLTLVFESRENMYAIDDTRLKVKAEEMQFVDNARYWTGSSFDGTTLELCEDGHGKSLINECKWESDIKTQPYLERLTLDPPLKPGDILHIRTKTVVKDATHIMNPYFAHMVQVRNQKLTLRIKTKGELVSEMKLVVYADTLMSPEMIFEEYPLDPKQDGEYTIYEKTISKPNLNYSYCLEWQFL